MSKKCSKLLKIAQNWPKYDDSKLEMSVKNVIIQVNGKLRGNIEIDENLDRLKVLSLAKGHENVKKFIVDKEIIKEIYVPG